MRADTIILVNQDDGERTGDMSDDLIFGVTYPDGSQGALKLAQIFGYSIQANFLTGSPLGTLVLQASNDGVNFCDVPGASFDVTGVGSFLWNVTSSNYLYAQVAWTATGGSTGTLSALAYVRGF